MLFAVQAVTAQENISADDISDKELASFFNAVEDLTDIQEKNRESVAKAIENSELSEERFMEIHNLAKENAADAEALPNAEKQAYQKTIQEIAEIQEGIQSEMINAVEENGLEVVRFNSIMAAMRESEELRARFDRLRQQLKG